MIGETAVRLCTWRLADAEWYVAQARDDEIQRWTTERAGLTAGDARERIRDLHGDATRWVITDARTGERLGNAAVDLLDGVASASYWVACAARGRGVATAALRLMVAEAAGRGAHRVELEICRDNRASVRVAEKNGFRRLGTTNHPTLGACERWSLALQADAGNVA